MSKEKIGEQNREKKEYSVLIIELLKKADERQKKCVYQFVKAIIGEG